MNEKLIAIAIRIFGLAEGDVTMDSTPADTANWDSLHHIRLILETEEEFDIELDEDDITGIVDMKTLAATVTKHQS